MSWLKTNQKQYKNEQKRIDEYMDYKMEKTMKGHKESSILDHPDGSVTDEKIGERTVIDATADTGDFSGLLSAIINNIADAVRSLRGNFKSHKSDGSSHITDEERTAWNSTLNESKSYADNKISEVVRGANPPEISLRAENDADGNKIHQTYATKGQLSKVESIAKGANQAISFDNYASMIDALNVLPRDSYNVGQNIMIITLDVPDLWVSYIFDTKHTYSYKTDRDVTNDLKENGYIQVGHYLLSMLETQKADLSEYLKEKDAENLARRDLSNVTDEGLKNITSREFSEINIVNERRVVSGGMIYAGQTIYNFEAPFSDGTTGTKDDEYVDYGQETNELIFAEDVYLTSHDLPYTCDKDITLIWSGFKRASDGEQVINGTALIVGDSAELITDKIATGRDIANNCAGFADKDLVNVSDAGLKSIASREFAFGELRTVSAYSVKPGDVIVDFKASVFTGEELTITKDTAESFSILFIGDSGEDTIDNENLHLPYTVGDKAFAVGDVTYNGAWFGDSIKEFIVCDGIDKIATGKDIDEKFGDVETALDEIIAIKNSLIGGDGV